jgi:transmembrane sensor
LTIDHHASPGKTPPVFVYGSGAVMTDAPDTDRERADAAAAAWLVRLAEAPRDAGLRAGFEAWRSANPLNAAIWSRTSRASRVLGRHRPHTRWQPAAAPPRIRRPRTRLAIAAAALCAGLALGFFPDVQLRFQADRMTGTAEFASLVLPDGTEVELAPESAIDIAFTKGDRRVDLLKGEAFFSVARDPAHPFRIVAGDAIVTVLGTAFDVRLDGQGTAIAVAQGKVRVEHSRVAGAFSRELDPGDWILVTGRTAPIVGHDRSSEIAAWRHGQLVVRDRPAAEIVAALRPYYRGLILLRNASFETHRVSGIYDLRDPVATLGALADSYGAKLTRISPWILVVSEK